MFWFLIGLIVALVAISILIATNVLKPQALGVLGGKILLGCKKLWATMKKLFKK